MTNSKINTEAFDSKTVAECSKDYILAVNDSMNVFNGKWKIPIIANLLYGKKRFSELEQAIPKINPRMLSKELKDLEANGIIIKNTHDTVPILIEYELTESGKLFSTVLEVMLKWGLQHRENTLKNR